MDERNVYEFANIEDAKLSLDKKFSNLLLTKIATKTIFLREDLGQWMVYT